MPLTPEKRARMDEYRRRYEDLKAAGQGAAPRVMPAPPSAAACCCRPARSRAT